MDGLNLLDAVANEAPSAHLTFASSGEVYASTAGPHDEEDEVGPLNPYGASKASALEILCGQYARSRKLRIAVIRAFNQVGPGQARSFAASDFAGQVAEAEIEGRPEAELQVGDLSRRFGTSPTSETLLKPMCRSQRTDTREPSTCAQAGG